MTKKYSVFKPTDKYKTVAEFTSESFLEAKEHFRNYFTDWKGSLVSFIESETTMTAFIKDGSLEHKVYFMVA